MKYVVVSPHRDDAAFSLGLTIACWLEAGHTVEVLNCFTRSQYAPYSDADSLHENDRTSFVSALRRREDLAWGKLLGTGLHFHDLDLLDAPLRLACAVDEVLTVEIRPGDRALARVSGAIEKMQRTAAGSNLAIVLPLAVGGHIDHRIVREAGLQALTTARVPVGFYEDLPYAARPEGDTAVQDAVASIAQDITEAFACAPATVLEDRVQEKLRMAEFYDSQIDTTVASDIAEFCRRYGGRERLWVRPSWHELGLTSQGGEV